MSDESTNLGGRLPLLNPAELTSEQRKLYDHINADTVPWAEAAGFQCKTADGKLMGPFNAVLYSPEMGGAFLALQSQEEESTGLTEQLRQVVILSVGSIWKAPYELYAHTAVAKKAGLTDGMIRALAAGETCEEMSGEERIAQQFTRQLTAERMVDDEVFAAAHSAFGSKGLVEMVVLAGCYCLVCSLLNAFNVPAPKKADADGAEKE